jgi:polysaccharide pyruvyl transferase WcaK-like protein
LRIVAIGDIGVTDDLIHIGDEAMFDELVRRLRARGADHITGISSDPAETAARYGIESVQRIGFDPERGASAAASRPAQEQRMDLVLRTAAGETGLLADDDTAHAVIAAVAASDGVAIAGGGNMASTWPLHIFERATLGRIARILGKPLAVSGQTIGPFLTAPDAALVAELLGSAELVGLREGPSLALSTRLGVHPALLNQTIDDASFLGSVADDGAGEPEPEPEPGRERAYCVVTLANHIGDVSRDEFTAQLAGVLDFVVTELDLEVVFFAHFGSIDDGSLPASEVPVRGDSVVHARIAAAMTQPSAVHPTTDSPAAARLARGAALSVSSRYHPAVFASSGGVPAIGISVDEYTTTKLTGALGNFGQSAVLPITELIAGTGIDLVSDVWERREEIRAAGTEIAAGNREGSNAWWDRVAAVFA